MPVLNKTSKNDNLQTHEKRTIRYEYQIDRRTQFLMFQIYIKHCKQWRGIRYL